MAGAFATSQFGGGLYFSVEIGRLEEFIERGMFCAEIPFFVGERLQ